MSFLLVFLGCAMPSYFHGDQEHKLLAGIWVQNAVEYRSLCYQTFNTAMDQLKALKKRPSKKMKAIVMKIDGVILDQSGYYATLVHKNVEEEEFDSNSDLFEKWLLSPQLELIPGAQKFIKEAYKMGFEILFVSNRPTSEIGKIYQAMKLKSLEIKREHMYFKMADRLFSKRKRILEKKYDIVMELSDFSLVFDDRFKTRKFSDKKLITDEEQDKFGRKYFVFPNPFFAGQIDCT